MIKPLDWEMEESKWFNAGSLSSQVNIPFRMAPDMYWITPKIEYVAGQFTIVGCILFATLGVMADSQTYNSEHGSVGEAMAEAERIRREHYEWRGETGGRQDTGNGAGG